MKTIEMDQATGTVEEYARKTKTRPVVFTKRGKPVVALVSMRNIDYESLALSTNPRFMAIIERSRARQRAEGGISSEEMRKEFGLPPRRAGQKAEGDISLEEARRVLKAKR